MPLRRRQAVNNNEPKTSVQETPSGTRAASPSLSLGGYVSYLLIALALSCSALYFRAVSSMAPLADVYALCSRDGNKIYTVDQNNTLTQCIVVKGASIVDTGDLENIRHRWEMSPILKPILPDRSLAVHYIKQGAIVVPGLSDSHGHILEYGATRQLPLEGTKTIEDTVTRIRNFILDNPDILRDTSKFIMGGGWDHTAWPAARWPTSEHLDADPVIRGRPVILQSKDCHALWVSSKALQVSMPFPDAVEGGVILKNRTGHPTGVLLDNAQDLIKQPNLTYADLVRRFNAAVRDAHAYGITAIHDAGLDPMSLNFFQRQAKEGPLPLRIYGMTFFNENAEYWGNRTAIVIDSGDTRLTARSVKIFADGALRTGGSALHEPYADNPETRGFMRLETEALFDVIPKFLRDGWQVNVHAIGDRANGVVLDAFESALKGADVSALRPRLEHAQLMTSEDMQRLGKLGIIASIQPAHVISDMWYAEDRLGPERVKGLYAFRSMVDNGARIALGSDFPVETMNPLVGFYAAVTRLSTDGKSPRGPSGWFPEQRLTRQEALRGMTIDAAYASFSESILGSLEIGKRADYVVLSQDIMTVPESSILDTRVLTTALDGKLVYGSF